MTTTIEQLQKDYLGYLQSLNPNINTTAPNTYWSIQGGAMASLFLDLYYSLQLIENSIYVQNSVGNQVDLWLYNRGLPARGGLTYGTIEAVVTSTVPVTIPINTIFTDSTSGNQYQNLQAITATDHVTSFTFYAINPGNNYIEPVNANLSASSVVIQVISSTNGELEETDQACITRILQAIRAPIAGARTTDYAVYNLETNATLTVPVITDSIIRPSFLTINGVGILGVFTLVGTNITEYQLNQGLLPTTTFVGYSRQAGSGTITAVNNNIQAQRLVGLPVIVGTSITELITTSMDTLPITVSLVNGYSLSTIVVVNSQDQFNNPITVSLTVEQLIQREARRAICNQPYGGTDIAGQNYVTVNSIADELNVQLSSTNGQLAQLLTNITIGISDISVPNLNFDTANVYYTYDITAYSNIVVSQV